MPRKKGRAGKAEKLRRESVKRFGRAAGGVARGSKEHVRKAKERIWRYTEALAWKSLGFKILCGGLIPRLYNNIHDPVEFEHQAPAPVQQKKEQEPGVSPDTNLVVGGSWHTATLMKNVFSELK